MSSPVDITGTKINCLTAICLTGKRDSAGGRLWRFKCDCGNYTEASAGKVRCGQVKSCGKCVSDKNGGRRIIGEGDEKLFGKDAFSRKRITIDTSMIGRKFGRLTVIGYSYYNATRHTHHWECKCSCGNSNSVIVEQGHLLDKTRPTQSCGCLQREAASEANSECRTEAETELSERFTGILKRCYNKNCKAYPSYGGRGITVCDEWKKR